MLRHTPVHILQSPNWLDEEISVLLSLCKQQGVEIDAHFRRGFDDYSETHVLVQKLQHAANLCAMQAVSCSIMRLNCTLEAMMLRFEPVDHSDDFVSLESDLEQSPPEKTASGD